MTPPQFDLSKTNRKSARAHKFEADIAALEAAPVAGTWLQNLREVFSAQSMARGLEAARANKVRRITIGPGEISGQVRAEVGDTREVSVAIPMIPETSWDRLVEAMSEEAIYAACLLERRFPPELESKFASQGVPLVPRGKDMFTVNWDGDGRPERWRAAAIGWILAQRLLSDPLLIVECRGQSVETLSDRLRQTRTLKTRGGAAAHPDPPLAGEVLVGPPLVDCVERFWRIGPDFDEARRPARLDHIPHALLRRLGPSTMETGKFPMSGLLATIYDTVAEGAIHLQDDATREE